MEVYINAITYYLPKYDLTNEVINSKFPEWSVDKISTKTGIKSRKVSAPDEFSADMATKAAEKLFNEYDIDKGSIDFLLICTQSPDYFLPTTACIVQEMLGLEKSVGALDFNLGCSGYVYGLSLAKGLIAGGMAKRILLITSETYSKFIHPADKSNLTIFGDAASATLITAAKGFCKIDDFIFGTDGKGAENLIVKRGGARYPTEKEGNESADEFNNVHSENNLYMNGPEIFNFTAEAVPVLVKQVLEKHSLEMEDISYFIFHQANKYLLNHLRKKIGIPEEKFIIALENYGNTVSSTIPIAICDSLGMLKQNNAKKVLIAGFGVGYSWAGCIIDFEGSIEN